MTADLAQEVRKNQEEQNGPFYVAPRNGCMEVVILVEVEGGIVQDVNILNQCRTPIKVVVRDYDNLADAPEEYQDACWRLN